MKKGFFVILPVLAAAVFSGCAGYGGVGFESTVQSAKDKVFPAVVYIRVLRENKESGKDISGTVSGSGVLISPEGEIVTNCHVVDKALSIRCLLSDGRHFEAELVGSDKEIDLALVKLKTQNSPEEKNFPYAVFASGEAKEGDFVMAMGAPWGLSRSVTIGIISSANRYLDRPGNYSLWYQTDAAIFPGNSGGPLVNTRGEIVGINTLGISSGGMGFSIPAPTVRLLAERFRKYRQANWAWTGLELQPLRDFNRNIYFEGDRGVVVAGVEPGSPAEASGVKIRDRLLSVNGVPANALTEEDIPAVNRMLGLLETGREAELGLERGGKEFTLRLVPVAKGSVEGESLALPRYGITVKAINRFADPDLYYYCREGVFVLGADPGNTVVRPDGLQVGDVILELGKYKIRDLKDMKTAYDALVAGSGRERLAIAKVMRNGAELKTVLDFADVNSQ